MGLVALVMVLPTSALASATLAAEDAAEAAERAAFVDAWTEALLAQDDERIAAMPGEEAYADWDHEQRTLAIDELFANLEANRPADAEAIVDVDEVAFVKGFLHGFIFERSAFEAAANDVQASLDATRADESAVEMEAEALRRDREIEAIGAPHADALRRHLALWSALDAPAAPVTLDELRIVPALPSELDAAFDAVNPLLASVAGMSASGTYTLHVVADGKEQTIQNVPIGVPVPVDADLDGTTGPGGVDFTATLNLQGLPALDQTSDDGAIIATVGGVGPALTIERIGGGDHDTPDLQPASNVLVEAFIPLENGRQMARIGFDTSQTGMPAMARVTLVPSVEAATGALAAIDGAVSLDEANGDARATADMAAGSAGAELPWEEVDAAPGAAKAQADAAAAQVDAETAPARELAAQLAADAEAEVDKVGVQLDALLTQLGETGDATADWADAASQPARAMADEAVAFYGERVDAAVAIVEHETQPARETSEDAIADVGDAAQPAMDIVDESVAFYSQRLDATLDQAAAALAAAKADAYATVVSANGDAGNLKNEYVYGDGVTQALPPMGAAPPQTPFDDEPAELISAAGTSVESTDARVPPRFTLAVESVGASGDLVVIGGFATREDTADAFEEDATLVLRFTPAPSLLTLTVDPSGHESASITVRAAEPVTMAGLVSMRAGEKVSAMGLVMGELPDEVRLEFAKSAISYEATAGMDILGFFSYSFATLDDFVAFVEDGVLTGRYAHAIAAELPTAFSVSFDEDAGRLAYESEGGRMGGLEVAQARFAENLLAGYLVRGRMGDLPTSFELIADGEAAAFEASEPLGSVEFERTNGLRLGATPQAFVVAHRVGADDLVHLRILGLQTLTILDDVITMDLAGGYPLVFQITAGDSSIFGQFGSMPNHLRFAQSRSGAAQTVDVTFLPEGFGLWAALRNPSLGTDIAVVGINDLAGRVIATTEPTVPRLTWDADRITGGVFAGLYTAGGATKAAISLGQIPSDMVIEIDQYAQGFPRLGYSASHSTLDLAAYVGGELLTGLSGVYLALIDMPRNGLGFSVSGNAYNIWSNGPERLGRWYMDVGGINFAGGFSYHNRWVDNWILQVGADVELAVSINVRHLYLQVDNLRSMGVNIAAPILNMNVDGVLQLAFDTLMYSNGYASFYAKVLWGWICLICYYVSFDRAGWVPMNFHSWGYSWNVWRWNYLSYPIGFCSWTSVKIENRWVEVGMRLPSSFTTHWNGYKLAYGSANVFVNPGALIPTNLVWAYAAATGFSATFREYTTHHCT